MVSHSFSVSLVLWDNVSKLYGVVEGSGQCKVEVKSSFEYSVEQYGDAGCFVLSVVQYGDAGRFVLSVVQYGDAGCFVLSVVQYGDAGRFVLSVVQYGDAGRFVLSVVQYGDAGRFVLSSVFFTNDGICGNSSLIGATFVDILGCILVCDSFCKKKEE